MPVEVQHLVKERFVKVGLKTDSLAVAAPKARELNARFEKFWQALVAGESEDEIERRRAAIDLVTSMGFAYQRMDAIIAAGPDEMVPRLLAVHRQEENLPVTQANWGPFPTLVAGIDHGQGVSAA